MRSNRRVDCGIGGIADAGARSAQVAAVPRPGIGGEFSVPPELELGGEGIPLSAQPHSLQVVSMQVTICKFEKWIHVQTKRYVPKNLRFGIAMLRFGVALFPPEMFYR